MLSFAIFLDGIGFVLAILFPFGADDYGLLDFFGIIIIGSWIFLKSGGISGFKNASAKKNFLGFFITSLIETIPILGSIVPTWTIFVYKNLQ